ncbi:unnamed protein product [Chondrus crispus]|uniref:Uncharacterized protein n=1 Tax=Chondrus crispus TaxID=2769 RepID=R7QHA5_CHOCR|nr:unnamed protein product [Chondrus crispus]CDF37902.1 unnamed protein product [Chondrus crispus]|eukprot:XP_005717773.1 unnamed protein product [Chondrus crispus]
MMLGREGGIGVGGIHQPLETKRSQGEEMAYLDVRLGLNLTNWLPPAALTSTYGHKNAGCMQKASEKQYPYKLLSL